MYLCRVRLGEVALDVNVVKGEGNPVQGSCCMAKIGTLVLNKESWFLEFWITHHSLPNGALPETILDM